VSRGVTEAEDGQLETAERAFTAALELPDMLPRGVGYGAAGGAGAGAGNGRGGEPFPNRMRADVLRRRAAVRIDR